MAQETRNELFTTLKDMQNEPSGYFCYEDIYCDMMGCEADDCEEHFGSVLEAIHHTTSNGTHDVTVIVGTGGPHFELKTKECALFGYWGSEEVRVSYDKEKCEEVGTFWRDIHECK